MRLQGQKISSKTNLRHNTALLPCTENANPIPCPIAGRNWSLAPSHRDAPATSFWVATLFCFAKLYILLC
jgi:hypothetical protein